MQHSFFNNNGGTRAIAEKTPKRHCMMSLGHLVSFFFLFSFHFCITYSFFLDNTHFPTTTTHLHNGDNDDKRRLKMQTCLKPQVSFFFLLFFNSTNYYLQINCHHYIPRQRQTATSTCPSHHQDKEKRNSEEVDNNNNKDNRPISSPGSYNTTHVKGSNDNSWLPLFEP